MFFDTTKHYTQVHAHTQPPLPEPKSHVTVGEEPGVITYLFPTSCTTVKTTVCPYRKSTTFKPHFDNTKF